MVAQKHPDRARGTILGSVASGLVKFAIRAVPMPAIVTAFLTANIGTLKRLQRDRRGSPLSAQQQDESDEVRGDVTTEEMKPVKPEEFWTEFEAVLKEAGREWTGLAEQVWAFGPRRIGPNLLVDRTGARS